MKKILVQLDTDHNPSVFDRVVAVDAGVDELFSYGGVNAENVVGLVHGAMFTRSPQDLKNTAIFIGGSDVTAGEHLLAKVQATFFGPIRVSVLLDSNGPIRQLQLRCGPPRGIWSCRIARDCSGRHRSCRSEGR